MRQNQVTDIVKNGSDWLRECWNIVPSMRSDFVTSQQDRIFNNCRISEVSISPCQGRRGSDEIDHATDDGLYATFYRSGNLQFVTEESELQVGSGDLLFWNPQSPASFKCESTSLGQTIIFPKEMVERRVGACNSIGSVRANSHDPRAILLKSHILQVLSLPDDFQGAFSASLLEVTLELIFLCTAGLTKFEDRSIYNRKLFDRISENIRDHISCEDFSPAKISGNLGLSVRHLQNVLAAGGTTFTAVVKKERLDRAAQLLRSPASKDKSIAELACSLGFYDGSHFSNAFRSYYKMSPRQYRNLT